MTPRTKPRDSPAVAAAFRFIGLALLAVSAAWSLNSVPAFVRNVPVIDAAARVMREETFRPEVFERLVSKVDAVEQEVECEVDVRRAAMLLRLRAADLAIATGDISVSRAVVAAFVRSAEVLLACSPHEPFALVGLFYVETVTQGISERGLARLEASYRLGPLEGWIMRKRSALLMPMLAALPAGLQALAIGEFVRLVADDLSADAAAIFLKLDAETRERVLPELAKVDTESLSRFSRVMRGGGVEILVPGAPVREQRPWHRG